MIASVIDFLYLCIRNKKIPQTALHGLFWGSFAFTEFDLYKDYEESFKQCEIGRIHALLPLYEMAVRFGLVDAHPRKKAGRKPYFSPEGKVALMFLKSYTGLSAPKLMETNEDKTKTSDETTKNQKTLTQV